MLSNICITFVCNKKYFNKFVETCNQLINIGKYQGSICLVIGDDLVNDMLLTSSIIIDNNIIIKYFSNIKFSKKFHEINRNIIGNDGRHITKTFQWHKMHLFNVYFKQWRYIFYIDCGMKILDDISPMLKLTSENTLLAHSDTYPTYNRKLHNQFSDFSRKISSVHRKLFKEFDLNIDYFQTGIMLYDTNIIEEETYNNLVELSHTFPISKTNEQGIMNLYFNCIKNIWKQIPLKNNETNFYIFKFKKKKKYIIVKVKNC
jgi:hypothetical protein